MEPEQLNPERIKEAGKSFLTVFIITVVNSAIVVGSNYIEIPQLALLIASFTLGIFAVLAFVNGCVELILCTKKHKKQR